MSLDRGAASYISLGQSLWSAARWTSDETKRFELLTGAEDAFGEADRQGSPLGSLCLSRLCRHTARPNEAIVWYLRFFEREPLRRRALVESHLVGESAVMLLYRASSDRTGEIIERVRGILLEAVESGYEDARVFVTIARLCAGLGEIPAANGFLNRINVGAPRDWVDAISNAAQHVDAGSVSFLSSAFKLGLNDGLVWNSLGTYAKDVLSDRKLALDLYRRGVKLSPKSPVLHTNLARELIEAGTIESLNEAASHIAQAKGAADLTFRWWKPLAERISELLPTQSGTARTSALRPVAADEFDAMLAELRRLRLGAVVGRDRGEAFARIVVSVLRRTFGVRDVVASRDLDGMESDASFRRHRVTYRAEISFDSRPNDRAEIDKLLARLNRTTETRGILISGSGFTAGAKAEVTRQKHSKVILLLDAEDIERVLCGQTTLEMLFEERERVFFAFEA